MTKGFEKFLVVVGIVRPGWTMNECRLFYKRHVRTKWLAGGTITVFERNVAT